MTASDIVIYCVVYNKNISFSDVEVLNKAPVAVTKIIYKIHEAKDLKMGLTDTKFVSRFETIKIILNVVLIYSWKPKYFQGQKKKNSLLARPDRERTNLKSIGFYSVTFIKIAFI